MLNTDRLCLGCMHETQGERICPHCGYDSSVGNSGEYLPVKFWLSDRYLVGRTLSIDSEGVSYVGFDNSANRPVIIKEYFPSGAAVRNPDKTVFINSGAEYAFNEGLMDFIEIAKKLSSGELSAVIPVLSVFEENGTAYKISEVFTGITLADFLSRNGGSLRWEQARPLFLSLIDTVIALNGMGIFHGGISPETVLVGRDGKLRLNEIFIPAVRRKRGGDITAELYDGYAALEQYGPDVAPVGEYTDVYGICATLFRVLVGTELNSAPARVGNAGMSIPAKLADELPRQVLVALANGLQVYPNQRTVSVESFKNELVYGETEENLRRAAANRKNGEKAAPAEEKSGSSAKYVVISAACTAVVFAIIAAVLCLTVFRSQLFGGFNEPLSDDGASFVMPSVPSIGDVDPNVSESKILYATPSLVGQYYSQIIDNEEYEHFKFAIKAHVYSDKYPRGTVCEQSLAEGTQVENETEIGLTISLGAEQIKLANLINLDEQSAKLELLKQGFLYENIEVVEKYDEDSKPGIVLEQLPEPNTEVSNETVVRIYVNSYEGEITDGVTDFSADGASSSRE